MFYLNYENIYKADKIKRAYQRNKIYGSEEHMLRPESINFKIKVLASRIPLIHLPKSIISHKIKNLDQFTRHNFSCFVIYIQLHIMLTKKTVTYDLCTCNDIYYYGVVTISNRS